MGSSPPASPEARAQRPLSALMRSSRPSSRISIAGKTGGGSRASDEDGKTAVKVVVRVRPPLNPSDPGFELIPQRFQRSMAHVTSPTSLAMDSPQGRKLFVFDRVFGQETAQEGIWDYLSDSVNAFVQGYNVSVMAYGQSGAGKSFTMGTSGPAEQNDPELMGVVPRAAKALFERLSGPPPLNRNGSSGLRAPARYSVSSVHNLQSPPKPAGDQQWQMKVTYVEIYNEQLRDLLVPEEISLGERSTVSIREDTKGRILLTGLHQVTVNSVEDLLKALNFGSTIRQTDATAINTKSSRSHAVFSVNLIQRKHQNPQLSKQEKRFSVPVESLNTSNNWITIDSKLHFVDLAGSERLKNTGASGERAREGISINAGLQSLGKVISQLSSRAPGSHVSYRDSKLTRLLQDSLGGNAVTYMVACVTPAEFHLSETLNTVHYAQRARMIQSRPRIQQTSDESDKQALIDRLRAEVSFLREQIRNSHEGDRAADTPQERMERQHNREIELQNHLLDSQESYSALSQRHAKLISEMAKIRDHESLETPTLNGAMGKSAVERLERSNSFESAVKEVVLEYEKTIVSLETSLSNTRSSLSVTESNLLERETHCAYIETVNQQLQTRLQKLMDREASTETYLNDLEARLGSQSSGDDQNAAAVAELRKELTRIREIESGNEDYIATLEERVAEREQDLELVNREIARLEHVVERQRSLGKLDVLLDDLDSTGAVEKPLENGYHKEALSQAKNGPLKDHEAFRLSLKQAIETPIPESDEEKDGENPPLMTPKSNRIVSIQHDFQTPPQSPAQFKTVADKLDNVTQELFDLRVEHESTVSDYDLLAAKFDEALRQIAILQDAQHNHRGNSPLSPATSASDTTQPTSFLEHARVHDLKDAGQAASSRSLSLEMSSSGVSPTTTGPPGSGRNSYEQAPSIRESTMGDDDQSPSQSFQETDFSDSPPRPRRDQNMNSLHEKYVRLQQQHEDTLDLVEELKAEVHKAKLSVPLSPSAMIRRKSSQTVMAIDRAHRSLASLGNIAAENFEDKPDTMQHFEVNLNTAMHELHQRSERVQVLESELSTVRKEMETKMTIISGLTRERSSLSSASPIDISVVSSMRDQVLQSQSEIMQLHEIHHVQKQELVREVESLKETLSNQAASMPGGFSDSETYVSSKELDEHTSRLQGEVSEWQSRHQAVLGSMEETERKHVTLAAQLEAQLKSMEAAHLQTSKEAETQARSLAAMATSFEQQSQQHAIELESLNANIENHKTTINTQSMTIANLKELIATANEQVEEGNQLKQIARDHLDTHRKQIALLEEQVAQHQSAVEFHKHGLRSLHDSHSKELDNMRSSILQQAEGDSKAQIVELTTQHQQQMTKLQEEADLHSHQKSQEMQQLQDQILDLEAAMADARSKEANLAGGVTLVDLKATIAASESAKAVAEAALSRSQAALNELNNTRAEVAIQLRDSREKEERAVRLVQELESQLNNSYEHTRVTSSRLSQIQSAKDKELMEARAATAKAQEEIEVLSRRLENLEMHRSTSPLTNGDRANSINWRQSSSIPSLPSPPPAIPLPPLPTATSLDASISGKTSPPPQPPNSGELQNAQLAADQADRIRSLEKHLRAEKQLTATLEDALGDLEGQGHKTRKEVEMLRKKTLAYEEELSVLRRERNRNRESVQAAAEEKRRAEEEREKLEERMAFMGRKKKKSGFNCF